jgi:spermidine/putrescine transport system ATP-binding protein
MIRIEALSKSFDGKTVLSDFFLEIKAGERFVLLGQSGCGKTTLLRSIAGFEKPSSGKIWIEGEEVTHLPVEKRPVGFIFQNYALFPHMSIFDNIAVGPRLKGFSEPEVAQKVNTLLETMRLMDLRDAYPGRLSGGESQRAAIARAIANQPKVLLLDEPLSALDLELRQSLRYELVELQQILQTTFLFVTHDQEEAMSLATRMAIMKDGVLLQAGTPEELYDRPNSPETLEFLGDANRLEGGVLRREGGRIVVVLNLGQALECESENNFELRQEVLCFLRPERLFLTPHHPDALYLEGKLVGQEFLGDCLSLRVELAHEVWVKVRLQRGHLGGTIGRIGETMKLYYDPKQVQVFAVPAKAC